MDESSTTITPGRLFTAGAMTGRDVINNAGEQLGEIQEIVFDGDRGCIAYAVLEMRTGMFGGSRKMFAVPWQSLRFDTAHRDFVLDVDKDRLRNAPGFDDDDWPAEPDATFASSLHDYYGYTYGQGRPEAGREPGYDEERSTAASEPSYGQRGTERGYGGDEQSR